MDDTLSEPRTRGGRLTSRPPRAPSSRTRGRAARSRRRSGFTFVEILFAVMILSIGFILTAAIFPVAITQVSETADQTSGAAAARSAVAVLRATMTEANAPATGGGLVPVSSAPQLWQAVRGNLVASADSRYAWAAAYRRDEGASIATVVVFVVRSRNRPEYDPGGDVNPHGSGDDPAVLDLRSTKVRIVDDGAGGTVHFTRPNDLAVGAVASGAYLVTSGAGATGEGTGHVYRVGEPRGVSPEGDAVWSLVPGGDVQGSGPVNDPVAALLVGRGYADAANPARGYAGASQDVAVYFTFVAVR